MTMVWKFVDAVLTLMAVPNLIALRILSPEVVQRTRDCFAMDHRPTRA